MLKHFKRSMIILGIKKIKKNLIEFLRIGIQFFSRGQTRIMICYLYTAENGGVSRDLVYTKSTLWWSKSTLCFSGPLFSAALRPDSKKERLKGQRCHQLHWKHDSHYRHQITKNMIAIIDINSESSDNASNSTLSIYLELIFSFWATSNTCHYS